MPETLHAADQDEASPEAARRRETDVGLAGQFLRLQQSAGNRAVSGLVQRLPAQPGPTSAAVKADDDDGVDEAEAEKGDSAEEATEPTTAVQAEGEVEAPEGDSEEATGPTSGTIPDKEPTESPALEKGAGVRKEDGGSTAARPRSEASNPRASRGGELSVTPGAVNLDVNALEKPSDTSGDRADSVAAGTVTNTFTNPDTSPSAEPFGSESFSAGWNSASFKTAGSTVTVDFTLDIKCPWGTKSGGIIDVPSATDPVVTEKTYQQIVKDLTPNLVEKSWRAPRSKYWSDAICKRHEKFHSTDDKAWSEGAGKQVVTDYLASKRVNKATAGAELQTHLADAVEAMKIANGQFYTGGAASYFSYTGEERAFGDGKQPYIDLAQGVKTHGESLKAARELGQKWGKSLSSAIGTVKGWFGS